jgi:hypothetical protein
MENLFAMVAISAAILLSKKHRTLPIIILAYYAAYVFAQSSYSGFNGAYLEIVKDTFNRLSLWHLLSCCIELLIIIALCINCKSYPRLTIAYAVLVGTSLTCNGVQAISMTFESNWFIGAYTIRQQIAIPLDILFAWMGSDNVVSKWTGITPNSGNSVTDDSGSY